MNKIIWMCLFCLVGISCTQQDLDSGMEGDALILTVNCVSPKASRAETKPGEEANNENLIKSLHYFFYQEGETDGNAVFTGSVTMAETTQDEAVIRIPMNENVLNNVIFPRPANNCEVYVIANLPSGTVIPDDTSVESLKQMAIETDFKSTLTQPSFIMAGQGIASIIDRNKVLAASGEIPMDRLAAKLTVNVQIEDSYTDKSGKIWKPAKESLTVSVWNAASNTTLGGALGDKLFSYENRNGANPAPFYSYPREWEFRSPDALSFYIVLPWKCETDGSTEFQDCYYKVLPNTMQLTKNNWYHINLKIGVLGSFDPAEEPVVIDNLTYQVANWNEGLNMDADLLETRYLVVDNNNYVLNNQMEYAIPYTTSHACIIKNLKVERTNLKQETETTDDLTSDAISNGWVTLNANTILLNHPLNNDLTYKAYDITPYKFTFTLCHTDNEDFSEEISIVQNPAIIVDAKKNEGPNNRGYVFVNGNNTNNANYGGVHGLTGSGNQNPNMYVISTTVLPENSQFILGDPRMLEIDNVSGSTNAKSIQGENRQLSYYYPTNKTNSVENMISPKFRIASSYGVTETITYANATARCATYQEDGYPAGRWRLPTMAEVKYIIKLSADEKIPTLFTNNSDYWCANGSVKPNKETGYSTNYTTNSGSKYVRCVYDEWYWEKSNYPRLANENKGTFTWGDESR